MRKGESVKVVIYLLHKHRNLSLKLLELSVVREGDVHTKPRPLPSLPGVVLLFREVVLGIFAIS